MSSQRLNSLDAQPLILAQTTISFITAPFLSPSYNFPLFLFGTYASEKADSIDPLRLFSGLLGTSILFDIIWLINNGAQNGFVKFLTIINMLLKIPTAFAVLNALRLRGDSFASFAPRNFTTQNVWTMPGGFGVGESRDGYQNVGDDLEEGRSTPPPPPPVSKSSVSPSPAHQPQHPPGGYHTLS